MFGLLALFVLGVAIFFFSAISDIRGQYFSIQNGGKVDHQDVRFIRHIDSDGNFVSPASGRYLWDFLFEIPVLDSDGLPKTDDDGFVLMNRFFGTTFTAYPESAILDGRMGVHFALDTLPTRKGLPQLVLNRENRSIERDFETSLYKFNPETGQKESTAESQTLPFLRALTQESRYFDNYQPPHFAAPIFLTVIFGAIAGYLGFNLFKTLQIRAVDKTGKFAYGLIVGASASKWGSRRWLSISFKFQDEDGNWHERSSEHTYRPTHYDYFKTLDAIGIKYTPAKAIIVEKSHPSAILADRDRNL